jgi:CheY-like chemotaxis protein
MTMKILILEDNADRQAAMRSCLNDRFHQFPHVFFDNALDMRRYLENELSDAIAISLDHDLELKSIRNGKSIDPGTGRDVADFLAERGPSCPIVIATTNSVSGDAMEFALRDAGWKKHRVHPWGDLDWIPTQWFRALRDAIVGSARRDTTKNVSNPNVAVIKEW